MPCDRSQRLAAALAALTTAASAGAVLIGVIALIGRSSGTWRLATGLPLVGPTTNPAAAVASVLAGAALALLRSEGSRGWQRRIGKVVAGCVAAIGAARLGDYLLGTAAHIDQVGFVVRLDRAPRGPNRMALEAALGFTLLAAALLQLDVQTRRSRRPAEALAALPGVIGSLGITGYVYLREPFDSSGWFAALAPETAFVLLLLALGVFCARPNGGVMAAVTRRGAGGAAIRRYLPIAVGASWLVGALCLEGARMGLYTPEAGAACTAVGTICVLVGVAWHASRWFDEADRSRRLAEEALRHNESQVRSILDNATVAVFVKDLDGVYRFVNRTMVRLLRGKRERILGRTDHDLFPRGDADVYRANDQQVIETGTSMEFEEHARLPDGDHTYVTVKFPLFDADGVARAVCGISTDITPRKRSEESAARLRDRITTTNRILGALAASSDEDLYGDVVRVLADAFDSPTGFLGQVDEYGDLVSPVLLDCRDGRPRPERSSMVFRREQWTGLWGQVLLEQRSVRMNGPHTAPLGHDAILRSLATPIVYRGKLLGILHLANRDRDYGEDDVARLEEVAIAIAPALRARLQRASEEQQRRKAEVELRALAQQLQVTNEGLESFSYSVSHDLRAPLRAIGSFAKILAANHGAALDAEGRRLLGIVCDSTRQASRLVDDLLAFSRLDRREMMRRPVDMEALVWDVVDEIRGAQQGRDVQVRVMGPLPPVMGDASLLRQVLVNLVGNAWKFTRGRQSPSVEIEGRRDGRDVIFAIRDNGAGFDMRYVDKLFGVFERLHTAEQFEGTGVGLALVRRIVERHGGRVWADGRVAIGATFSFALPARGDTYDAPRSGEDVARRGQ